MRGIWKAHGALLLVNLLYAASHVIAKDVMPTYLSPNVFILLRVSGACLLFWLMFRLFAYEKVASKDFFLLAICGLFGVAINQLFFFHGLNQSSAFNAGIIMAFNPIIVLVLSFFILKNNINYRQLVGVLLGATGAILLTMNSFKDNSSTFMGDVFLVVNTISYALYLILAKPLMAKYRPLTVVTWIFTFGLLFVLLFPPMLRDVSNTNFSVIPMNIVGIIIYVIVGVTFLTYLLTMYGLKHLGPTISSTYIYAQPVMVIFFTIIFATLNWTSIDSSSSITTLKFVLMMLIFIGVYLSSSKKYKK
jgi:drug/metabolite transporter (DMT)-like permease